MSFLNPSSDDLEKFRVKLASAFGLPYKVEQNKEVTSLFGLKKRVFDFVVFNDDTPIAGIEYKTNFVSPFVEINSEVLIGHFREVGLQFGILYYGEGNVSYFWKKGTCRLVKFSFDDIVAAIKGDCAYGNEPTPEDIIQGIFNGNRKKTIAEIDSDRLSNIKRFMEDESIYDKSEGYVSFKPDFEDRFFMMLLPTGLPNSVCRYTSLRTLFLMMESKKQSLCSITCMNDRGETAYADQYISYGAYSATESMIKENNDCFILSCCNENKRDDLTMWRLYGDEAKGACLEYDIDHSLIDNKEFFCAPVSYGKGKDEHPELELIIGIRQMNVSGWKFRLNRWYIWKHFFKSYLFREEQEVRLLYNIPEAIQGELKWIMDSTNSIVSRIFLIPIESKSFPLKLKSAIIGPKCPEQATNVEQFNYMNTVQRVFHTPKGHNAIIASVIEDYR